jgi:hypothetical protein
MGQDMQEINRVKIYERGGVIFISQQDTVSDDLIVLNPIQIPLLIRMLRKELAEHKKKTGDK